MDLEVIIEKCIQDERFAQKRLYMNYKDALYTIAYRITGNFSNAEDLLQETFIEAFRSLKKLKEPKYFYSWIRKILIRKCYNFLKKEIENENLSTVEYKLADQSNPLETDYIEKAIFQLPIKSRTVFIMSEIEGFSHKEIADAMGISVGTSKSQLNYAKSKLKTSLKKILAE